MDNLVKGVLGEKATKGFLEWGSFSGGKAIFPKKAYILVTLSGASVAWI